MTLGQRILFIIKQIEELLEQDGRLGNKTDRGEINSLRMRAQSGEVTDFTYTQAAFLHSDLLERWSELTYRGRSKSAG